MGWGAYIQNGFDEELDKLGAQLSLEISCAVHYPAYGKHMFECKHDVMFPVYIVKGGDWDIVRQKHNEEMNQGSDYQERKGRDEKRGRDYACRSYKSNGIHLE